MCWTSFRNSVAPDVEKAGGWSQTTPALAVPLSPVSPLPLPPPAPLFFVEVPLQLVSAALILSLIGRPQSTKRDRERESRSGFQGCSVWVIFSILALM